MLGVDNITKILTGKSQITTDGVLALNTIFGWVLCGSTQFDKQNCLALNSHTVDYDVDEFWKCENINLTESSDTKSDNNFEKLFMKEITYLSDGRLQAPLLWKNTSFKLESNFEKAHQRLKCLTKRLQKDGNLLSQYDIVFKEYEKLGITEPCSNPRNARLTHYLSH